MDVWEERHLTYKNVTIKLNKIRQGYFIFIQIQKVEEN